MGEEDPEGVKWYNTIDEVPVGKKVKPYINNKEGQEIPVLGQEGKELLITKPTEGPLGDQRVIAEYGHVVKQCTFFSRGNTRFRAV